MSASEMVVIIRPSFKKVCGDDACRAAVFNHVLYWIARKVKQGNQTWYITGEDLWKGLAQSWGLSKTLNELKALITAGFIGQCRNPKNGWDQTRHYFFGEKQAKVLRKACEEADICLIHIGLPDDMLHLLKATNAFDGNNKCICSNQQIETLDETNGFIESNGAIPKRTPKILPKETTKEEPVPSYNVFDEILEMKRQNEQRQQFRGNRKG